MKLGAFRLILTALALPASVSTAAPASDGAAALDQQQAQRIDPQYSCIVCHTDMRRAFLEGVHSERGIRCHDCHGGDPRAFEVAAAHADPSFVGTPDKIQIVELCSSCHSDPNQMRQYGLTVGQLAEFQTSRHGQLLLRDRNFDAPTCTDCHNAHMILPPNDARSNVYPTNIVITCARCHENAALMGKYGLQIDQVKNYRESAHGVALFQSSNFAAPTCIDCHGSHAALPPAVLQIANVCGHCHVLVRRAFYAGPHGKAALDGRLPGCTACHSNHGTERVLPEGIADTCVNCHGADTPAVAHGEEVERLAIHATEELGSAAAAIDELVVAGHRTSDVQFRYQTARTSYLQIGQAQHSLDLTALEDLSREVASISRDIRGVAEVAAEHRWEHKLILLPVWFLTLSVTVLAWFRIRSSRREGSS
ncbi:MAG: cytochrome c3 family protein [Gemmatimonadota bacterium]|nr:MAG: cytochrome c3 family protein [Gemmatimonadota bacterium]